MGFEEDFNHDMKKLIHMPKKILKGHPLHDKMPDLENLSNASDVNLNVFIFPFFPLSPEEMEELADLGETSEASAENDIDKVIEYPSPKLNPSDVEFLRRHGIKF